MTAAPAALPLHIDRPGGAPVALDRLTLLGGLEVPVNIDSPIWAKVEIELANGAIHDGAVRIVPPQRMPGAPPLSRLGGVLLVVNDKLVNPIQARERQAAGLAARDVLPMRLRFDRPPPHPLRLVHATRDDKIEPGVWSRELYAIDLAADISRLSPF